MIVERDDDASRVVSEAGWFWIGRGPSESGTNHWGIGSVEHVSAVIFRVMNPLASQRTAPQTYDDHFPFEPSPFD